MEVLDHPATAGRLGDYFDPKARPWAGGAFERLGVNEHSPYEFGCHDLLALTLLDVRVPARATAYLLFDEEVIREVGELLSDIPIDVRLWDERELEATNAPDHICALNGADTVYAGSGDDIVEGGNGDDVLLGEAGNDVLIGGNGTDSFVGGPGWDVMHGGRGADILDALDGFANDEVDGGLGADDCTNVDAGDDVISC